ncbi:Protein hunchback, partial [Dissostichus eleginoides]
WSANCTFREHRCTPTFCAIPWLGDIVVIDVAILCHPLVSVGFVRVGVLAVVAFYYNVAELEAPCTSALLVFKLDPLEEKKSLWAAKQPTPTALSPPHHRIHSYMHNSQIPPSPSSPLLPRIFSRARSKIWVN